MKYIFLAIMTLLIYSCKNEVEPTETFSKSWVQGYWQMEGELFNSYPQDTTFTFSIEGDSIKLQNLLLMSLNGTKLFNKELIDYKGYITKINNSKSEIEFQTNDYPYYGYYDDKLPVRNRLIRTTSISATLTFENNNKATFKASGDFYDSLYNANTHYTDWKVILNKRTSIVGNGSSNNNGSTSVQCKGTTQKGERCKNMTKNASGYCYLHG